jgi:dienelactone hydrolase
VVIQYLTYKVGTFKGTDARVAAYYSFPDQPGKHPAFVWTHGGGQRAERTRGKYFASQGYAVIDINWLGRPMEEDIEKNTDWGKVDPTQGPNFYPKALRKHWKRTLAPDEHSIDPVPSPRNSNWFLLAVAGKRGITFLEQQPEVDGNRIGFAGFSMGGVITAMNAIDPRLKAVAPFVGGTGFRHVDFSGIPRSSQLAHYQHLELYKNTIDCSSTWPLVQCPVAFITSSNDFHSTYERIQDAMNLLPHNNWRVSANLHINHGPGPEQWALLNQWFDQYLKGEKVYLPRTPESTMKITDGEAVFTAVPKDLKNLEEVEIYYSYDPNSRTRFWKSAPSDLHLSNNQRHYTARFSAYPKLPIYAFAQFRYKLDNVITLQNGSSETITVNSVEQIHEPKDLDLNVLSDIPKTRLIDDFSQGTQNWATQNGRNLTGYNFQNPELECSDDLALCLTINPQGKDLVLRINTASRFLGHGKDIGDFHATRKISGQETQKVIFTLDQFEGEKDKPLSWSAISNFTINLTDLNSRSQVSLFDSAKNVHLLRIEMIAKP